VLAVLRAAVAPEPIEAGVVVGELPHELHEGVARVRRPRPNGVLSIDWRHSSSVSESSTRMG
jgi:hypothetical protein